MHGIGKCFGVNLADLVKDGFGGVHGGVALHGVVVSLDLVFRQVPFGKGLNRWVGCIRRQTHMGNNTIGSLASEFNDLVVG